MFKISEGEYQRRMAEAQKRVGEAGLDAILVHSNEADFANVRYFCDYWPIFETTGLFIPKKGEPVLIIGPETLTFAKDRSKVKKLAQILEYRESADPAFPGAKLDTFESIAAGLGGAGAFKKIGVCGMSILPVTIWEKLREAFPGAAIAKSGIVSDMRRIKSDEEIAALKAGFAASEKVLEKILGIMKPGMRETEVVGHIQRYLYEFGGEYEAHPVYVLSGKNSNHAIGRATHKVIEKGDLVQLNLGARIEGYSPSVGRPVVMGKASPEQKKLLEVGLEAHFKTYEWMKEGEPASGVTAKFYEFVKSRGCEENYLYGPAHGLGMIEVEEPWVESNSAYAFQPNMTFQVDTFLQAPTFGLRWENGVRIVKGGNEMLSRFRTELIEIV
ncbi:MAG: aminopeptidase P family protein [Spirochaetes bacterium]|nr:aminopeptidase P family protein [Spirochaetota bacterium]